MRGRTFRAADAALLRAAADPPPEVPPWPDLTGTSPKHAAAWTTWLQAVWSIQDIAEAIDHASPALARQVRALCDADRPTVRDARRAVLSMCRYLQRMTGRSTPFGMLAGVAPASFGSTPGLRWGYGHQIIAHAAADWLHQVITRMEACPALLARLPVTTNTSVIVRGDRLIVPHQPQASDHGTTAVEVSIRYTGPVRAAIETARAPISVQDLAGKIHAEFPDATVETCTGMLTSLVKRRALISSLHAPGTTTDALGHLVRALDAADASSVSQAAELVADLKEIHALLGHHNREAPARRRRTVRAETADRMRRAADTRQHPLALDLRLDVELELPAEVAREIERAAHVLARVSAYPTGIPAWKSYHQRFYERFGLGSMVPLLDVVNDSGIGWPDGYPGTTTPGRRSPVSDRDRVLLALAQRAALDGHDEVVVDEQLIADLSGPHFRPPPHLEVGVRVRASDLTALRRGRFTLEVLAVSRAAGVLTGRFLHILPDTGRDALAAVLADLPASDADTAAAQLSFPPLDPATAHVTRATQTLTTVISLAEHHPAGQHTLTPADLAVGCDGRRMFLAAPARGIRLEPAGTHTLNLVQHTPPLARFLTELPRAQSAQVTSFHWGAARGMPYLPRLRYGRIILSPAQWRVDATDLPTRLRPWQEWDQALKAWRDRRRLPRLVSLTKGDRLLPLDLDQTGHRVLLRSHLDNDPQAVLTEAPDPADTGWCGGRPHELIVPLTCTQPPPWPALPKPTRERIVGRDRGQTPANSRVLLASLYGDLQRQDEILAGYLPELLGGLDHPHWWFVRYRDPDQHLRIRIALPGPDSFGDVARTVSVWADEMRQAGLVRELQYPTSYPETGRWGSGPAMLATEQVFGADSRAVLAQLRQPISPHRQALAAASAVAIACAFTGSTTAGMRWLIEHMPRTPPQPVPRQVHRDAVRLADPTGGWAALRATPGGDAIVDAWQDRDRKLAAYRRYFPGPDTHGIAVNDVLVSLLHLNHVRGFRIDFDDEDIVRALARAAALAWTARTMGGGA